MTTAPPFLPYGRQWIDAEDEAAVLEALQSPLIAHGPRIDAFEAAFAERVGSKQAVACSSGTAALHLSLATLDPQPGDVAIIPAITFLATATAAVMAGFTPRFCDVDPDSGLITADTLSEALEGQTQVRVVLRAIKRLLDVLPPGTDLSAVRGLDVPASFSKTPPNPAQTIRPLSFWSCFRPR